MFVLLIFSFYNALKGDNGKGLERFVDIQAVMIKAISISAAPSIILAGIAFGISKNYGNRLSGVLLSFSGVVFIVGMVNSLSITSTIPHEFFQPILVLVPYIFIPPGIGITIIGIILYTKSKKGIKKPEI